MNKKINKGSWNFFLEVIKWIGVIFLLIGISIGNYFYRDFNLFYRLIIFLFMIIFSVYLILLTNHGKLLISFSKESYEELCRVVWPTLRESLYTTLVVFLVTIVMALILWGLDSVLVYIVSLSLRL